MSNNGWIKLHRQLQSHWLWKSGKPFDKRSAWVDILLMVNHKKRKINLGNELIEVDRGERITSERKLSDRWGWSRTKVRNFLNLLKEDEMIEIIKDNKKTTLKVLNYSGYQGLENQKKTKEKPEKNQEKTAKEPQKNTNKNVKNEKNEKKINNIWDFYCRLFKGVYNPRSFSDKRKGKIRERLKTYSVEELKQALKNMRNNDYLCGDNENKKVYAKPEYCFRNDEKVEEWLNVENQKSNKSRRGMKVVN